MSRLHVITASAGSGKTTRLAGYLHEAIASGHARPEAVMAMTFTNQAAAELAARARGELLRHGRTEDAHQLLAGRLGTVNAVCGGLVEDFALELGLPPRLRILDEPTAAAMLERAIDDALEVDAERALEALVEAMPDLDWPRQVRRLVEAARLNGLGPSAMKACALRSHDDLMACLPATQDAVTIEAALTSAIDLALTQVDVDADATKATAEYVARLRRSRAHLARGRLAWSDWAKLAKEAPAKRSEQAAAPVQAAAGAHVAHPRLRAQLAEAIDLVFTLAAQVLETYQEAKRVAGTLDFVDQEAFALDALRSPAVREVLADELDLLLVDELQDTSPLQLAIFVELAALARATVWVGDPKQAIFGFRGTDPALMDAALDDLYDPSSAGSLVEGALTAGEPEVLSTSWRSRPALVEVTSALFAPAFERHGIAPVRTRLAPGLAEEPAGLGPVIEYWPLAKGAGATAAPLIAAGVRALLNEGATVRDRATGTVRAATVRDLAVLCRTNAECGRVADALTAIGLPAVLPRTGLLDTLEGIVAMAALRIWLDPRDRLAAAELARLLRWPTDGDAWLARILGDEVARTFEEVPEVTRLRAAREASADVGALVVVDRALAAIDLPSVCVRWGDAERRLANLDALRAHARVYDGFCAAEREPTTLAGLIAHLEERTRDHPQSGKTRTDTQARPTGFDAITVSTWHRAKGLEWPITIVHGLDTAREPVVTGVHVMSAASKVEAGAPLEGRWLRYWPQPYRAASKGSVRDLLEAGREHADLCAAAERERLRLLYVAWTRARDRLVLAVPAGRFRQGAIGALDLEEPTADGEVLWGGCAVGVRRRILTPIAVATADRDHGLVYERRATAPHAAAFIAPSSLEGAGEVGAPIVIGTRIPFRGVPDMTALGDALHGCFAADRPAEARGARRTVVEQVLTRWRVEAHVDADDALAMADRLWAWIRAHWPDAPLRRELPLQHRLDDGAVLRGTADLVIDAAHGPIVVDHKAFPGTHADALDRARGHAGQLAAYAAAIGAATGRPALGMFIHLPMLGLVVPVHARST